MPAAKKQVLVAPDSALWRLPTVLAHIPVSRSGWWAGVKEGRYPAPVKLSTRCVAWRSADIRSLIASF
ncbi:MAG: AlpA family phage regulatory protein [Polaromonas sp.]|nr:AlpA family phage regulatory protein [Polaromonas sp.]